MAKRRVCKSRVTTIGILAALVLAGLFGGILWLTLSGFKRDVPIQMANLHAKEVGMAVNNALERLPTGRRSALPEQILMSDGVYRLGDVDLTLWLGDTFSGWALVYLDERHKHVSLVLWSEGELFEGQEKPSAKRQMDEGKSTIGYYEPIYNQ